MLKMGQPQVYIWLLSVLLLAAVVSSMLHKRKRFIEPFQTLDYESVKKAVDDLQFNDVALKDNQAQLSAKIAEEKQFLLKVIADKELSLINKISQVVPKVNGEAMDKADLIRRIETTTGALKAQVDVATSDMSDLKNKVLALIEADRTITKLANAAQALVTRVDVDSRSRDVALETQVGAMRNKIIEMESININLATNNNVLGSRIDGVLEENTKTVARTTKVEETVDRLDTENKIFRADAGTVKAQLDATNTNVARIDDTTKQLTLLQNAMSTKQKEQSDSILYLNNQNVQTDNTIKELQSRPNIDPLLPQNVRVSPEGNVGIGHDKPIAKLDVAGNLVVGTPEGGNGIMFNNVAGGKYMISTNTDKQLLVGQQPAAGGNYKPVMAFAESGYVGISTQTPGAPLEVGGAIRSTTALGQGVFEGAGPHSALYLNKSQKNDRENVVDLHSFGDVRVFTGGQIGEQKERLRVDDKGNVKIQKTVDDVLPEGWGPTLHAKDVYADRIATGSGGKVLAYMSSNGDVVGRNIRSASSGLNDANWFQVVRDGANDTVAFGGQPGVRGIWSSGAKNLGVYAGGGTAKLTVSGTTNNVGINTEDPQHNLHVTGTSYVKGDQQVTGDVKFVGGNNWNIATPDDERKSMFIMPTKTYGSQDWDWSKAVEYGSDGSLKAPSVTSKNDILLDSETKNINAIGMRRKDENGRNHEWKWWHMNSAYGKNDLQLWEYAADAKGVTCGGNSEDGALCEAAFSIKARPNSKTTREVSANANVSVSGTMNVGGAARVATLQVNRSDADKWPGGWGGGVHSLDMYANGTMGAGANGELAAYMNSSGYFRGNGKFGDWQMHLKNKNVNAYLSHGDGYGMHINTDNQETGKYAMELHNGKRQIYWKANDGYTISRHGRANDWGWRMYGPDDTMNVHMNHSGGYGLHVNTNNQENGKYALELHNNKKVLFQVLNDGEVRHQRADGRWTHFDWRGDGRNYLRGYTTVDDGMTVNGDMYASGNVTAYSDARLKDNVKTIDHALDKVKQMRGTSFTMKKTGEAGVGLIAQEVEKIVPEVVKQSSDGYKAVAYGNLTGVLTEAIKELSTKVDKLETEAKVLKETCVTKKA